MQNIELPHVPGDEPRGRIRRIISPGGRHRATGSRPLAVPTAESARQPSPRVATSRPVTPPVGTVRPNVLRLADSPEAGRLDSIVTAYHQMVLERVDQGIHQLQQAASQLMGEVAAEVWKAVGPEAGENLSERVVGMLARDDSVRGLIAHADERYHALDVRIQRIEAGLKMVADTMKQAHLAVVSDVDQLRRSVRSDLARATHDWERHAGALATQIDGSSRRLHFRLSHAVERLENQAASLNSKLDGALGSMHEQLRQLDDAVATVPDRTAGRVAKTTGMMNDQVDAAAGALVRRVAAVADAAIGRVVRATEAAAARSLTTTDSIAARVAAVAEDATGRSLQATEHLAARLEQTSEALVNRFDAMGRVLVRAAARETEAISGLDQSLRDMREGLEDLGDSLDWVRRDLAGRSLSVVPRDAAEDEVPDSIAAIDDGFFGDGRRRRRLAG